MRLHEEPPEWEGPIGFKAEDLQPEANPPEIDVLLQLLDEIKDDWTGYGVKLRIKTMINERLDYEENN